MIIFLLSFIFLVLGTFLSFLFKKNLKLIIYSLTLVLTSLILLSITLVYFINENYFKTISSFNNILNVISLNNAEEFSVLANLSFEMTKIGSFFIFILSVISFCLGLYIPFYIMSYNISKSQLNFHLFNLSILLISIVLLFLTKNLLIFLILWEFMGFSSFFCIFFDGQKAKTINAAIQYIIVMHISFLFLLIGAMLCYKFTGSFSFDKISAFFQQQNLQEINIDFNKIKIVLISIFSLGFAIKLGIFPFHFWLPEAHPASPSHISSFMSSMVIKTGLYGFFLLLNLFGLPPLVFSKIIIFIGLISAFIGIINAASQTQIKKFLAYSSVENAGILLFLYGSAIFGLINQSYFLYVSSLLATFIYLLNHAFSKSSAFLSAGLIIHKTENDDLDLLGGLVHYYPDLTIANLFSSISLSALPPFGNFIGELLILIGYSNYIVNYSFSIVPFWVFLLIGIIGAITILSFTKYFTTAFLGVFRGKNEIEKKKNPFLLNISLFLPLIFALIFSSCFFYNYYFKIIEEVCLKSFYLLNDFVLKAEMIPLNQIFYSFYKIIIIFIFVFFLLFFIYNFIKDKKERTWSCGFISKKEDIFQYTSSSFVEPFISIFKPLTGIQVNRKEKDMIFPKKTYIETEHHDIVNKKVLSPIIEKINLIFDKFTFIQSGKTQHYILYGLIFLVIILIITLIRYF